jgi:hypothetical protein
MSMHPIVGDQYKHYKGNVYHVRGVAVHSETDERLVVYQRPEDTHPWARPLSMWNEPFCREPATAWPIDFGGWHIECRGCGTSADVIRTRSAV